MQEGTLAAGLLDTVVWLLGVDQQVYYLQC